MAKRQKRRVLHHLFWRTFFLHTIFLFLLCCIVDAASIFIIRMNKTVYSNINLVVLYTLQKFLCPLRLLLCLVHDIIHKHWWITQGEDEVRNLSCRSIFSPSAPPPPLSIVIISFTVFRKEHQQRLCITQKMLLFKHNFLVIYGSMVECTRWCCDRATLTSL